MKFLCIECDEVMVFAERQLPGDGTLAAVFTCGKCGREMAMLTNPMETRFVSSMGIKIGGREVSVQPMEATRSALEGGSESAFEDPAPVSRARPAPVEWSPDAVDRLQRVPSFVRGMVKRIYTDYARERGIRTLTPEIMDVARSELGLEGM
jgi:hypothetical protein